MGKLGWFMSRLFYISVIDDSFHTMHPMMLHTINLGVVLTRNPDVLRKVEAELHEHGLLEDPSVELTYDVIGRLQYVHGVSSEVLRLYPPAGAGFRKALKTLQIGVSLYTLLIGVSLCTPCKVG